MLIKDDWELIILLPIEDRPEKPMSKVTTTGNNKTLPRCAMLLISSHKDDQDIRDLIRYTSTAGSNS